MNIRCGKCAGTHHTTDGVRVCHGIAPTAPGVPALFPGSEPGTCTWLIAVTYNTDDGPYTQELDCGAISWEWADGRGYGCENGHTHTYNEVRAAEGWDYASDDDEARALTRGGTVPADLVYGGPYTGRIAS